MITKFFKMACGLVVAAFILVIPDVAVSKYRVSGVVEFTFRDQTTKTGEATVFDQQYFTQYYRVNLQGPVWDPRFMRFSGGVGYNVYSYRGQADSDTVDYDLYTSFFSGMKISWDLFGRKNIQNVESFGSITGYDIETTSYGATLKMNLGRRGFGRNYYNNNNNNGNGRFIPVITLSHIRTESESVSPVSPLDETRDDTRASLSYRLNSKFDLYIDADREDYENTTAGSSYDRNTANLASTIRFSPKAELRLDGRLNNQETLNFSTKNTLDRTEDYTAILDFKEQNGLRHYYRYRFTELTTTTQHYATHDAEAEASYKLREDLTVRGSLRYLLSDYTGALGTASEENTRLKAGGASAGASYWKLYRPAFMGPFGFNTAYDFGFGFTDLTSLTTGQQGRGRFYTNDLDLGINSIDWRRDTLALNWSYANKRDHSPAENNTWEQIYNLALSTMRVPRTEIRGSLNYMVQDLQVGAGGEFFAQQSDTVQQRRSFNYDLSANYRASSYLNLGIGGLRGESTSSTYSLSTLAPPSESDIVDEVYYAKADFTYPLTRRLLYRAQFREELRYRDTGDIQAHNVNMYLDYRIRRVFINFEYRWRQDIPENDLRVTQQYFFAKISRPF